jgi:NAD/NADP transhydrogenase alpha subunit
MRISVFFMALVSIMMMTLVGLHAAESLDFNQVHQVFPSQSSLMEGLTVFVLACFVGYYVVWRVTPALHSPLMAVTNAISSVIIVGAIMAAGLFEASWSKFFGFFAVVLASINIFGGFVVTSRMLHMFSQGKR